MAGGDHSHGHSASAHADHGHGGHIGHGNGHGHHEHHEPPRHPTRVFSTYGGWGGEVANWRTRLPLGIMAMSLVVFVVASFGYSRGRRYQNPIRPIPSQRVEKYALEDDPEYFYKREKYHANKKPLWKRILPVGADD